MVASGTAVADLLAARTPADRLSHLRAEGLADESGLSWLLDRAQELVHDEPSMAEDLAELCDLAADGLALGAVSARSAYLRGRVYAERGELGQALDFIERARSGWAAAGQPLAALRSDLGRMQVLDDLGRHQESAAVGEALLAALDEITSRPDPPVLARQLHAMAQNNLGATYSQVGNQERALEAYARAEADYLALGMRQDTAQPLANRGICLLALGRPRDALRVLKAAAGIFTEGGDRLWAAKVAGIIARAHQQLGELVEALKVLRPARETLGQLGAHAEAARIQVTTAEVYLAAGLFAEARSAAAAAAEHTRAQGMVHDSAVATLMLALAHMGARQLGDAARELTRAADLFDQVGDGQYRARVMLAQADLAAQRGHRVEAAAWADSAANALQEGGWLIPLAWAKLRQADLGPAGHTAARLADAGGLIGQLSLPELRYAYLLRLARLDRREGREEQAEARLRQAISTAEELGAPLPGPTLRVAFRGMRLDAHDELLDLLVARGQPADLAAACRIGDRAKAQTLFELIAATVGSTGAARAAPAALLEQRSADLSAIYGAMAAAARPDQQAALRGRAEDLEQEIGALRRQYALAAQQAHEPASTPAPSRAGPASQLAAARAAGDLPGAPTLAYHVAGDTVTAFVVRAGQVSARRLDGVLPAVEVELDRLVAQWSRFRMGPAFTRRHEPSLLATAADSLGTLYRLLVAPVASLLADAADGDGDTDGDTDGDLVVIPHRSLHRVPFHALHDGHRYLCERRTITLMPSITHPRLAAGQPGRLRPRRGSESRGALVFAVPDARSPAIADEAQELARVMPGTQIMLGSEATSRQLRGAVPGPAVLHLACHGLYRPANPLFSALRLADRWVSAAEILDLDLGGALVTLSACESGRPSVDTAEPVGLAWAFLAAGASGVIVSQWIVDDAAATTLMSAMYTNLAAGMPPAQALRRAQLSTAALSPHPYRWAPFVYVASPSAEPIGVQA
jgi:tetratricopeptide (TPR) repeat protein